MSDYTPQPNTFTLFANDKGDIIMPDGTKMRLSAWIRESRNGERKFLSGKVEPMQQQTSGGNFAPQDGDMPF